MSALLEVIALHDDDVRRAAEGGADRVELVGTMDHDGLSPEPALVERACAAADIPVRPMVRLRDGFHTDGGEVTRLQGLIRSYLSSGVDGVVLGFLNGWNDIDLEVVAALCDGSFPWTFHRAVDHVFDYRRAWRVLPRLPGLTQVLTAGSPRGVEAGLDELLGITRTEPRSVDLIMAGGGLSPEHVPWLVGAGVHAFHVGSPVRPRRSFDHSVDPTLVHAWRTLIDDTVARHASR